MPLNLAPDGPDLRRNLRAIERHLVNDHYARGLSAAAFMLGGNGAADLLVPVATPHWPAKVLPKNALANPLISTSFDKPSEWRTGLLSVEFWYTCPVASAATNFFVQVAIQGLRFGEVIPGTSLLAASAAYPGPAVINTTLKPAVVYSTAAIGSDDEVFSLRFVRLSTNASDTNANDFHLLYAIVRHLPNVQDSP